ncbi:MAG: hypothetical protein U5K37_08795 [Natrialbaceae archaeon]|nr:hypothetical protein [Natrialbaceae archaeon]
MISITQWRRPTGSTRRSTISSRSIRLLIFGLAILAVALVVSTGSAAAAPIDCSAVTYNGSGTVDDPWQVSTLEQLQCVGHENVTPANTDVYVQTADIDATSTVVWDGGAGLMPIGTESPNDEFRGTYNGQSNQISNLHIDRPNTSRVGLFNSTDNAIISNLSIRDAHVSAGSPAVTFVDVGIVSGYSFFTTFTNISVSGTLDNITHTRNGGGIVGQATGFDLYDSTVNVTIDNGGTRVGGVVGDLGSGLMTNISVSGSITGGEYYAGGVAGYVTAGPTIERVSSRVSVEATTSSGGIIGYTQGYSFGPTTIRDVHAHGNATGGNSGGLVGGIRVVDNDHPVIIETSYATGNVNSTGGLSGGIFGETDTGNLSNITLQNNYYNSETTNQPAGIGNAASDDATGLTTAQMQGESAETYLYGLDFTNVWRAQTAPDDYPILRVEEPLVESISLSVANDTLVTGEQTTATVTAHTDIGTNEPVTAAAALSTSNASVLSVTDSGTVTAEGAGQASVTATYANQSDSVTVAVADDELEAIPETYYGTLTINGQPAPIKHDRRGNHRRRGAGNGNRHCLGRVPAARARSERTSWCRPPKTIPGPLSRSV